MVHNSNVISRGDNMGHKHHKHKCCNYEKYECCGPSCGCNNFFDGCCGNNCGCGCNGFSNLFGGCCGNSFGGGCSNPLILLVLLGLFCNR
ncbi:hypothetical protein [Clostridium botulinum]|nr:hypothetical protein [Clostridium botulinum]BAQ12631.1 hypothetical protein CBB2_0521 [Clostridium botulinum]